MSTTTKAQRKPAVSKLAVKTLKAKAMTAHSKSSQFVSYPKKAPKAGSRSFAGIESMDPVNVFSTTKRDSARDLPRAPVGLRAPNESELTAQLVNEIAANAPDVDVISETYGLRREELSRLTGFSLRALADWSAGKLPSQPAQRRLHEIRRLLDALAGVVTPAAIPGWMRQPNSAFEKLSPLQVIELGEIDRLWAMIHQRA